MIKKTVSKLSVSLIVIIFLILVPESCTKEEGEGGNASIRGKVYAKYYNKTFTILLGEGYAPEVDVYIIYGDDFSYGDRIRTNYNGAFEFKYLRKGNYKVYAYSKDSTMMDPSDKLPVIADVKISDKNETIEIQDLVIFN